MRDWLNNTHLGDCRVLMQQMATDGIQVQTCITSPPYFRLRDYGVSGQIGLESTPSEYIEELVGVFRQVRELLSSDGTLWLVLGDSYASSGSPGQQNMAQLGQRYSGGGHKQDTVQKPARELADALKGKDLVGMPWRIALALQRDGWYLRSDIIAEIELYCPCGCGFVLEERLWRYNSDREIIWSKPNALPESVNDRPTRCHEYIFLLSKSARYYYDAAAIRERATSGESDVRKMREGLPRIGGKHKDLIDDYAAASSGTNIGQKRSVGNGHWRNRRSVWRVATSPFSGAHFAAFPGKLIEPCILAGSRPGDTVLEPFMGSGTTRQVAQDLGRQCIGCEINPAYLTLEELRTTTTGMPL